MARLEATTADANQVYLKTAKETTSTNSRPKEPTTNTLNLSSLPWTPGPPVNTLPSKIYTLSTAQLTTLPVFTLYQQTINQAYRLAHTHHRILGTKPRVNTFDDYTFALASSQAFPEDDAFTLILVTATDDNKSPAIHATISAHTWHPPAPGSAHAAHPMIRNHAPEADPEKRTTYWEIKLLAVDPAIQRQGLAGAMLKAAEKEILRRHLQPRSPPSTNGTTNPTNGTPLTTAPNDPSTMNGSAPHAATADSLMILLSSIREINYGVYLKRGYNIHYETAKEEGTLKSERPFTLAHWFKMGVDVVST